MILASDHQCDLQVEASFEASCPCKLHRKRRKKEPLKRLDNGTLEIEKEEEIGKVI